jgi:glycosyltransferase involved in cell wall biosynthesis
MQSLHNPLVTIVVPVFNGERYLEKAIRSLVSQSFAHLEVFVVDDGSDDYLVNEKIVNSFSDTRIRYIRKENGGVSTALNLAINEARGKYFTWLSHDDVFLQDKILKQVKILEAINDEKVVHYSSYQTINSNDQIIHTASLTHELAKSVTPLGPIERGILYGCAAMFNLNFLKSVGQFDENLRYVQDYDYWLKLSDNGAIFHLLDEPLVQIRIHEDQTGKINNTYDENYFLWEQIARRWVNFCRLNYNDLVNLENLIEFRNFTILNRVEGAVHLLNQFESEILKKYRVSVIVPIRGRLHLLKRCIKSILNQNLSNIEIIVIDDNTSNDLSERTLEILNSIDNSSIIYQKNGKAHGPAGSRNQALDIATGDFVAFLDSDDYYLPNKLANQLVEMLRKKVDFSHTNYLRHYESINEFKLIDTSHHSGDNQLIYILEHGCGISTSTVMVKFSDQFSKIRFDEEKRFGEDIFYFLDFAHESENPFLHMKIPGTIMRQHVESASTNNAAQIQHKNDIDSLINNKDLNRPNYAIGVSKKKRKLWFTIITTQSVTHRLLHLSRPIRYELLKIGTSLINLLPKRLLIKSKLNKIRLILLK